MKVPIIGSFLLAAAFSAAAQTFYAITDLGPGRAYAISESGHVAGETELNNGDLHAFLWTPDGLTDMGTLGGRSSRAFGINSNDWLVGEADGSNGASHACLWRDGIPVALAVNATAYAVNDAGTIAGVIHETAAVWPSPDSEPVVITASGAIGIAFGINRDAQAVGQAEMGGAEDRVSRAFVYSAGVAAGLADLGRGLSSSAQAINDAGRTAGFYECARGQTHAFVSDANGLRDVDTMNNAYSAAYGMNNTGDIVGVMFNSPNDDDQAFVSADGEMYNLNDLLDTREDWRLVEARDINDAGQVAGYGIKDGRERAFLLTPLESAGGKLPRVLLTGAENGSPLVEPATLEIEADIESERAIKRVTFYANGEVLGSVTDRPYRFTWNNAPAGDYDLLARALDVEGQMGVSPRVRVSIAEVPLPESEAPAAVETAVPALPPGADAP